MNVLRTTPVRRVLGAQNPKSLVKTLDCSRNTLPVLPDTAVLVSQLAWP
jgi:hypothetical protein